VARTARAKDLLKGALVVAALLAAFFLVIGVLALLQGSTCDRLDAERISHLLPGHTEPGPSSINVKPGEIIPYLEAEAAMQRAGCQ
jgi:hypothetical protein